ncbi:MAG: hypothetical protein K8S21_11005 [Gemmatimonadetes bacterium]|nr:hypothetical protein [Gemmatimonadota bacterium]
MRIARGSLVVLLVTACGDSVSPAGGTSFNRIQSRILDVQCVSCHSAGNPGARESGLILTRGRAFDALVGVTPRHPTARADGLQLVAPGSPDSSFLLHKLHVEPDHHAGDYGTIMPVGSAPLAVGEVEYIRRWIAAGAQRGGDSIDIRLLSDTTSQSVAAFVPPAPPATGVQLHVDRFNVAPRFERELFVYKRLGNTAPLYVNRVDIAMRANSHHFVIYSFQPEIPASIVPPFDSIRDIRKLDGSLDFLAMRPMGFHLFFGGSMTARTSWQLPAGIALKLPAGAALDLNAHYVNRTDAPLPGEVYANLFAVDSASVTNVAQSLFLSNTSIVLPPGQRTTLSRTFTFSQDVRLFMLSSHMHERGERFVIRINGGSRSGEIVFETNSWSSPDIVNFAVPIELKAGEGLRSEITWNNTTSNTIRFGLTSQDEMGIIYGYYWCVTTCSATPVSP